MLVAVNEITIFLSISFSRIPAAPVTEISATELIAKFPHKVKILSIMRVEHIQFVS
jgi:hypothetical protein